MEILTGKNTSFAIHSFLPPPTYVTSASYITLSSVFMVTLMRLSVRRTCVLICCSASFVSGNVCILTRAYITYVRPLLEYCSFIWSPYQICYIEKIEGIQRYFTRRVLKHAELPYIERLSVLKLESLEVRRIRADLKLCFKIIYGLCDLDTSDFFTLYPPSSVTRGHGKKLIGARCNTNWQLIFFL